MDTHVIQPVLRCTCPRHPGGWVYASMVDFIIEHQGGDLSRLLESEMKIVMPEPEGTSSVVRYAGQLCDFDHAGDFVLVTVYPDEHECEVAFRRNRWEVWGPPGICTEVEA